MEHYINEINFMPTKLTSYYHGDLFMCLCGCGAAEYESLFIERCVYMSCYSVSWKTDC